MAEHHPNSPNSFKASAQKVFARLPSNALHTLQGLGVLYRSTKKTVQKCLHGLQVFSFAERECEVTATLNPTDLGQIKAVIKDLDLGEFLALQGHLLHRNKMCCPFCGSGTGTHKTPAFHLFPDKHYRCFSCQAHGDIIDFVMHANGLDFIASIRYIAQEMGIPIPDQQPGALHSKGVRIQIGSKFIFEQEKNSIVEVPRYRYFYDREAAEIFEKRGELEVAEKLCTALGLIAMVLAEHDEEIDLIVEIMGTDFEKRYFALMNDKRFAFGKIIEWQNKNLKKEKEEK